MMLEKLMVTESSGDFLSGLLIDGAKDLYSLDIDECLSLLEKPDSRLAKAKARGALPSAFPSFKEWTYPDAFPSGSMLRDLYQSAKVSEHNRTGVPDKNRFEREIQAMPCQRKMAQGMG